MYMDGICQTSPAGWLASRPDRNSCLGEKGGGRREERGGRRRRAAAKPDRHQRSLAPHPSPSLRPPSPLFISENMPGGAGGSSSWSLQISFTIQKEKKRKKRREYSPE